MEGLVAMLAADAVFTGDGGGGRDAFRVPIVGGDKRRRALAGIFRAPAGGRGRDGRPAEVNGQPGWIAREADGAIVVVMALDILDDQVLGVRSVVNPDKLTHLGRTSDLARRRSAS